MLGREVASDEHTPGESSALASAPAQVSAMSSSPTTEIVVSPEDALAERVAAMVLKALESKEGGSSISYVSAAADTATAYLYGCVERSVWCVWETKEDGSWVLPI